MQDDLNPDTDLVLTRTLNAPREALWRCWTTPAHLMHWFVPKPHAVTDCEMDLRPGGAFNTRFEVDGTRMDNAGVFLELRELELLVFTDTYTAGWKPAPEPFMTAIIRFEDLGQGQTRYTAIARHRTPEAAEQHRAMGFFEGWGIVADQLEAYATAMQRQEDARTMVIERRIAAPVAALWRAWTDPQSLPQWWGPDGFSCRTRRADLRAGGNWVFDMIGPDGATYPNHHRITRLETETRIDYTLLAGQDGPEHARASVRFAPQGASTMVSLRMVFADPAQFDAAKSIGAEALGQQTLAKLERFVQDAGV